MIRLRHKILLQGFMIFDQVILIGSFLLVAGIVEERGHFEFVLEMLDKSYQAKEGLAIVLTLAGWLFVFTRFVRYDANRFTTLKSQAYNVVKATTFTTLVLLVGGAVFDVSLVTAPVVVLFWVVASVLLVASRALLQVMLTMFRRSGRNTRHLVMVGAGSKAVEIAERIGAERQHARKSRILDDGRFAVFLVRSSPIRQTRIHCY